MKHTSLYIARRYLFAKKQHNIINIISIIASVGVAVGTAALIIVLSVFNGLQAVVQNMLSTFDPDIKIELRQGKVFSPDSSIIEQLQKFPQIQEISYVLEESALLRYDGRQAIATIKGVSGNYLKTNGLDTCFIDGFFAPSADTKLTAAMGYGLSYRLGIGTGHANPLMIYLPRRTAKAADNMLEAFSSSQAVVTGLFLVAEEYDSRYLLIPLQTAREVLEYTDEVSALELKVSDELSERQIRRLISRISDVVGGRFFVKDRYQQHETFYKIMRSEKWAIFAILSFIVVIASFNIIGSLSMLIIDKKHDIEILASLGAGRQLIRQIFIFEGWLISILGSLAGLVAGFVVCWLQYTFKLIPFPKPSLLIDAYPVELRASDFLITFGAILFIGYLFSRLPVSRIKTPL